MTWEDIYAQWCAILPLSDRDRDRLSRKFTIEFNYNSNHIEGNTLTYGQTELLLLFGKVVGEAEMKDFEEMKASNVGLKTGAVYPKGHSLDADFHPSAASDSAPRRLYRLPHTPGRDCQ